MDFAAVLYHDLGKAIVMMQSWTDESMPESMRWEAVQDDVLRTRRDQSGEWNAIQVWNYLRQQDGWVQVSETSMGLQLSALMSELGEHLNALHGSCSLEVLQVVEQLCRQVHSVAHAIRDDVDV